MEEQPRDPSWTTGAARGLMTSFNFITGRIGRIAERMDEVGTDFMGHVDLFEDPAHAATSSRPFQLVRTTEDTSHQTGMYSLPPELQYLIILRMKPNVDDLASVSRVNRAWYLMSRDVQVWSEMYARGLSEWSFVHGPRIQSPSASGSSSPVPVKTKPAAWFTSNSLLFRTVTQPIFAKIEAFRNPRRRATPTNDGNEASTSQDERLVPYDGQTRWWIRRHLRDHFWNIDEAVNLDVTLPPKTTDLLSKLLSPSIYTIPVFGPGVGGAQKLIYDLVSRVPMNVTMLAGVRGVGTGIGFHSGSSVFKLSAIHEPPQPFHTIITQDATWRAFFRDSALHIYAVSDKVALLDSRADLASFLDLNFEEAPAAAPAAQEAVLASSSSSTHKKKIPLLILSFVSAKSASEVAEELGLLDLPEDQLWAIKAVDTQHRARDLLFCLKWLQSVLN